MIATKDYEKTEEYIYKKKRLNMTEREIEIEANRERRARGVPII